MTPALSSGDRVLVLRHGMQPRVSSIVLLRRPHGADVDAEVRNPDRWMVKRVAAVAGDDYPALVVAARPELARSRVPTRSVAVLGDNPFSMDSKQWGAVDVTSIGGVVIFRLRPAASFPLRSPPPER
jgi:signal peptidase I